MTKRILASVALVGALGLLVSCGRTDTPVSGPDTQVQPSAVVPATPPVVEPVQKYEEPAPKAAPEPKKTEPVAKNPCPNQKPCGPVKKPVPPSEEPVAKDPAPASDASPEKPKETPTPIVPTTKPDPVPTTTPSVTAPAEIVFKTGMGDVLFFHAKHSAREGQCTVCHAALFPQDKSQPLHFKEGMHQPAMANKTSCGSCHSPGGKAFAVNGNCAKCHKK